MFNIPAAHFLTAALIASIFGLSGFMLSPLVVTKNTEVRIEPKTGLVVKGEPFTVSILVNAGEPTNVFKGLLTFDPAVLSVEAITYNTSIADLWAEEPWYSNGNGTIGFIGGSTKEGGFVGEGSLLTITFTTKAVGNTAVAMKEMVILKHDGLGTEVPLFAPIDALFAVSDEVLARETILTTSVPGPQLQIVNNLPDIDLNDDGVQSMADVSIFMVDVLAKNVRSDFNADGAVDLKDLSILTKQ